MTSIDSEHIAWLVMYGFYTNRRGFDVEMSLRRINTPSSIQLSKNLCRLLRSLSIARLSSYLPTLKEE